MISSKPYVTQSAQLLLRWRWLVALISPLAILYELYEHNQFWTDLRFWVETGFYGLIVPTIVWLLLTLFAQSLTRQEKGANYLVRHQTLRNQLTKYLDWKELTDFVTQFPSTFLPLTHTGLFIYNHHRAEFSFTASWSAPPSELASPHQVHLCDACSAISSPKLHLFTEQLPSAASYCLPLFYERLLVGVIRLSCSPGRSLTSEQAEFLNAIAPEIALALIIGMAYPRQLAQARSEARLMERKHIAYLLHNSLAQQIGYLHLSLDRLATDPQLRMSFQVELDHMREAAGEAYELTRSILSSLQTSDQTDLTELIRVHAQHVAQRSGLHLAFVTEGEPSLLVPQLYQDLFSLAREGLHNVEKHAHAQYLRLALHWAADQVSLELMDDGRGFDQTRLFSEGHYGLTMMRERIAAWRGDFQVTSAPGAGTMLKFQIPLPALAATLPNRTDRGDGVKLPLDIHPAQLQPEPLAAWD